MIIVKRIIIPCIVFLILLLIFEDIIANLILEKSMRHMLGLDIEIGKTNLSLLGLKIDLKNIFIFNPDGFKDRLMANIPRIYIDLDPKSLLRRTVRFNNIELDLKELIVIKNKEGKVNIKSIKSVKRGERAEKPASKFNIDRLELTIGKAIYKDYSQGEEPLIKEYNINIEKEIYTDIQDLDVLVRAVMAKALVATPIARWTEISMDTLKRSLNRIKKVSEKFLKETVPGEGRELLKKTRDLLKDTLRLPYNKNKEEK